MNITIDDTSPQLVYTGNWTDWRPASDDPDTDRYFRGTFHSTFNEGAYVSYTFNGTKASVFGSFWLNHGCFSASVDGGQEIDLQGYTPDRAFDQLLFDTGDLPDGTHEIRMINRPLRTTMFETNLTKLNGDSRLWFDLDYIVVQVPVAEGNNVSTRVIDDTDATITYSPEWRQRPGSEEGYYNVSAHDTNGTGAGFALPFKGSSIQLFGMIGPDVGSYSVSIDGQTYPTELNGTWYERRTNSPLFFISGLTDGPHVLNLVNLGRGIDRSTFEFDYAVVNTTVPTRAPNVTAPDGGVDNPSAVSTLPPPRTGSGTSSTGASGPGQQSGGTSIGAIVGGVVGGLAALALLALLLCLRKRRGAQKSHGGSEGNSDYFEKTPVSSRFGLPLSPLSKGRDAVVQPLPYQGGHASRGIPSAQAYSSKRNGGSDSHGDPGPGSAMNRAALGTSINTLSSNSGSNAASQANSNSHSMLKRGFDPTSDVSSTTWEGSPGPGSPNSEMYASPSMHLLHHHQGGYGLGHGHGQHVPLSALPQGQAHLWPISPLSPSPMQYPAGYPHLGTPLSPLAYTRNDPTGHGARAVGDADDDGGEIHPHDSCSNVGGPTHTHHDAAHSRPASLHAPTMFGAESAVQSSQAAPTADAPPGYVESVGGGHSAAHVARPGKR